MLGLKSAPLDRSQNIKPACGGIGGLQVRSDSVKLAASRSPIIAAETANVEAVQGTALFLSQIHLQNFS